MLLIGGVSTASADVLESWGAGTLGTDYDWFPIDNQLVILHGSGNDYKFWVHDGTGTPGTGVINNITVDPNATGDFSIQIEHPSGAAGALDWNEGNLTYAGGVSTVMNVRVAGQLGQSGKTLVLDQAAGGLYAGDAGKIAIHSGTAVYIDIDGSLYGLDIYGPLSGNVIVGGYLTGALRVYGDCQGWIEPHTVTGSLVIDGEMTSGSRLAVTGIRDGGVVHVGGDVALNGLLSAVDTGDGEIRIDGNLVGELWIYRLTAPGLLTVAGDVSGDVAVFGGGVLGLLEIRGDLSGSLYTVSSYISGGRVYVHGSLRSGGSISTSALINNGAIAIDYDGWHAADTWQTGATVTIDETTYTGNTPALNIWEIQPCKGAMTNRTGVLDPNDLTWLASVIADPNYADYIDAFPGLDGSI